MVYETKKAIHVPQNQSGNKTKIRNEDATVVI